MKIVFNQDADMKKSLKVFYNGIMILLLVATQSMFAQHRGDQFSFQGIDMIGDFGVRSSGMGDAYTAVSGDISSLYFNPAGLADISKNQLSVGGGLYSKLWRECQQYRPTKYFSSLSLYLEELYIPPHQSDTAYYLDGDAVKDASYNVTDPKLGTDPYTKAGENWHRYRRNYSLNNVALAVPLDFAAKGLVVAVSYNSNKLYDYDRNDTYLDPHPGYTFYNVLSTANMYNQQYIHWYRYKRQREGTMNYLHFALAYQVFDNLQVGIRSKVVWGKTNDNLGLSKYGSFWLYDQNIFGFRYEDGLDTTYGTSKFSSMNFSLGVLYSFSKFKIGGQLTLPYTLTRKWDYTDSSKSWYATSKSLSSGEDKLKMPFGYSFGVSYTPLSKITLSFDYEKIPYGEAEKDIVRKDKYYQDLVNQYIMRFGLEYRPYKFLSLSAGYKNTSQIYSPDGAADRSNGPVATGYSCGAAYISIYGRLDVTFTYSTLRYYDSYYTNTNYAAEFTNNIIVGYTINF
jgi:hypothetical protein